MKKALALILTLIMVLGLMPAAMAAMEPASQQQIGNYTLADDTDGTLGEPREGIRSEKTLEDGKVIISKNIAATQTENVFDITLTVKTTEEIKEVTSETADAAVVLVIDISNSMTNMDNAQKAAQAFINSFAPAKDDTSTRKIAIVAFGTSAHQISGWVDASTLKTASDEVHPTISGINPNINGDTGGTNMHAGLLEASKLLKDSAISNISNKNVLLFTDGVPTYHINNDGLGGSGNIGLLNQQIEHDNHAKVEETVRNNFSGIGKYAVYLGNERIYCESYECQLYGYVEWIPFYGYVNYGGEAVKNWLNSLKSSDGTSFAAYSTSNASELANIFKSISELIKLKAQAWQLTDPMGDNIEFVQFLDANIGNKQATQSGGTISWDLKRDITKVHDDANKVYTYTLSYRIKLNTLSSGFEKDTFYKTNGVTDLTYFIEKQGTAGGLKHAYFNVPSVKGFAGDLTFTKVGANNEPLAGAAFKITANDDPNWSMVGTPSADGTSFTFTGIPSGHTYTLTETKTPEGYQGLDGTYTVEVAYGTAVLKKGTETVTAIVNTLKETPTGSLTITKVFGEGSAFNAENWENATGSKQLAFKIVNEDGKTVKTVTLPKNGQWIDTVQLAPGTYTVTETGADVTGYGLTVTNDKQGTSNNGETGTVEVTSTTPATITFTNTYTKIEGPKGVLTISKTVTGLPNEILPESFTFEIKQGENVVKRVTVNKEGNDNTYKPETVQLPYGTYTISEVNADVNGFNLNPTGLGEITIDKEHEEVTVNVTNAYEQLPPNTGTLTVKKTVSGGGADYNKAFTFTVKLEESGDTHNGEAIYGGVTFINGVATFTLKHNQEKKITEIPAGMTYTVTESDNAGYTVTSENDKGTIEGGKTADVKFTNTKGSTPTPTPTPYNGGGGHNHYYPTTTPVPVIVIPPKTGDMTVWQSILHFLGIR